MAYRNVFFSFGWDDDVWRAMQVRNSWVATGVTKSGFRDAADVEEVKRKGATAIKNWIERQLNGTTVTVVLLGANTHKSEWVAYETNRSKERGNGIVFIDISQVQDNARRTTSFGGLPTGWSWGQSPYLFFKWQPGVSHEHLGAWVEQAATNVGH